MYNYVQKILEVLPKAIFTHSILIPYKTIRHPFQAILIHLLPRKICLLTELYHGIAVILMEMLLHIKYIKVLLKQI